jgi:DNA-directed RNA polymerase subunit RPC12/RpoP
MYYKQNISKYTCKKCGKEFKQIENYTTHLKN